MTPRLWTNLHEMELRQIGYILAGTLTACINTRYIIENMRQSTTVTVSQKTIILGYISLRYATRIWRQTPSNVGLRRKWVSALPVPVVNREGIFAHLL